MVARALPLVSVIPLNRSQHRVALLLLEEQRATERFIDDYYRGRCNPQGFVALADNGIPVGYVLYHFLSAPEGAVFIDALTVMEFPSLPRLEIEVGRSLLARIKSELSPARPRIYFPTRCFADSSHAACREMEFAYLGELPKYFIDGDTAFCYEYHAPFGHIDICPCPQWRAINRVAGL